MKLSSTTEEVDAVVATYSRSYALEMLIPGQETVRDRRHTAVMHTGFEPFTQ